ncbi:PhaF2 protein [Capnocytophaga canimorsus]|uniref:PhaF2 protein n=1 Tax=Capnocytophaga canimorsus TaxID=28188 RepID=A0A0B7HR14_9FLAO|nr:monovalent cation/H+ antiporter complex subunit F [Capnocytophaga canimorsus]CEN40332.1 PhaF2 protein [Capnocytophaga canimorsus]
MDLQYFLTYIIMPILAFSALLIVVRFMKGPHLADRVVAVDLLFSVGTAIISIYSIISNHALFLDIATIFALIAFLSTVAFSYYLVKKSKK